MGKLIWVLKLYIKITIVLYILFFKNYMMWTIENFVINYGDQFLYTDNIFIQIYNNLMHYYDIYNSPRGNSWLLNNLAQRAIRFEDELLRFDKESVFLHNLYFIFWTVRIWKYHKVLYNILKFYAFWSSLLREK
jgi:hypothetical protein